MRVAWFLFVGLGLVGVSCGESTPGDLFASGTTGGTQGAAGSGGSGAATGAGGSKAGGGGASVGTGGNGTGGKATGASGSGGSGTGGAGMTGGGGAAGSGGDRGGSGPGGTAGAAGNGGAPRDGGGGSGMGGSAGGPPDSGGPLHPIRCGTTTCSAPGEFCCIPLNNQVPRCVPLGGPCPANADRVACDDRTDCPALQICCAENPNGPGVADCRLPVNCDAQNAGQQLCDPQQTGSCFMSGLNSCMLDLQAIIPGYSYCQ